MKTTQQVTKTIIAGLAVSLALAVPIYAQVGKMAPMSDKMGAGATAMTSKDKSAQCPMMGGMKIEGQVSVNGQMCNMKCDMMPMDKSSKKMGHSMMGKGGMDMSKMHMTKPMKMMGTMNCMGNMYHGTMTVTPKSK